MRNLWMLVSIMVFLAFSYFAGGVSTLIMAVIISGFILLWALHPKFAVASMYFFIGFDGGLLIALVIAYYTNPHGIWSALLFAFPIGGTALALWYGRKSDFTKWPIFGYRYKL
ncbi:hypothetical protein [Thermococcus sp.]